jgi:hypothetical protein
MGFPDSFIDLVMDLYTDSNCRVKVGNKTTKVIQVGRGVKQGDPLSPLLFNIAIEPVLRLAKNEFSESAYECFDSHHNILAYADDLGLITNDIEAMRKLLTKIETLMGNMQIKLNASKCATLSLIKGKINISNSLSLKNEKIQALDIGNYYEYLGKQIGIGNDRSPTQMLKSFISDIYKINRSLLSDWQKLDAIKTFVISRLGFILRNGDVPRSVLKQVDRALIDVSRKICKLPKSSSLHFIRGSVDMGGLGILGPVEEQEIQLVTHAFRLLTSPVKTIKDLAWNSLLSEVTFKLKKVPSNEELCQYLNGVTEGTFRLLPSQGACLWNRIRTMTRQLHKKINLSFQIQDNQTVILHMKHPSHDNTHVHSNSRDHCYSALRASIMGFHSDTLISTCKDQGRSFHQISQDKINSKFISDGRFISHPTFRWIHAARLNQL